MTGQRGMGRVRYLVTGLALAVAYFLAAKLGLRLAYVNASATAVWPPTGIALAALLTFGTGVWPGIFVGAFVANLTTAGTVATSLGIAAGNTLEGLVGAYLVNRFAGGRNAFDRVQDVFRYALFAGLVCTAMSATIGVSTLALGGLARWDDFGSIWPTWWLGDAGGALKIAPALILWARDPNPRLNPRRALEALVLMAGLIGVAMIVFVTNPLGAEGYAMKFLCMPPLLWAAFRFGPRGGATAILALAGVAVWGTLRTMGAYPEPIRNDALVLLQVFMGVASVTTLAIAAEVSQRRRVESIVRDAYEQLGMQHRQQSADLSRTVDALRVEVTGRSRAEVALRESEQRFRLVTELASDAIVVADEEGHIVSWNRGAESIFGYRGSDVMGWSIDMLAPLRCRPSYRRRFAALRAARKSPMFGRTLELWGQRRSGSEFPLEVSITSWNTRDGRFFSGIIRDITERKRGVTEILRLNALLESRVRRRTADLERSNRALTEFTSVAAHDLQEPLRTVATFTDLLARRFKGKLDAEADRLIAYTDDAVSWMHALIRDLLAFSRVGTETMRLAPVDAQTALGRALANLQGTLEQSGAVVTHDRLPTVKADSQQLVQVFQNLIGNAIKFRDERPPRVHISADREAHTWRFSVRDNGKGMEVADLDRIFQIFQRLHPRRDYPGTGVGLAICKRIVERHGGRIWADSEVGEGSVFLFTMPEGAANGE